MRKTTFALTIAGAVAVAGAAVAVPAQAATTAQSDGWRASLTAEQRQCLKDHGVGAQKGKTKDERLSNLTSAASACGVTLPERVAAGAGGRAGLTAEQRKCLADAGVTRPQGVPSAADVQKMRDAATACGVEVPARLAKLADRVASLTDEQRQCLTDKGVGSQQGKTAQERRANLKSAAEACGISVPARAAGT